VDRLILFVRGEITAEDLRTTMQVLGTQGSPSPAGS